MYGAWSRSEAFAAFDQRVWSEVAAAGGVRAPRSEAPPAAEAAEPRGVIRGSVLHAASVEQSIGWFRGVGSMVHLGEVAAVVERWFGELEERDRGLWSFKRSVATEPGVLCLYDDEESDRQMLAVEVPQSALELLTVDEQLQLLGELRAAGVFKCTRIDLPVDFKATVADIHLVQAMHAGIERHELVRLKKGWGFPVYVGEKVVGYTVYMGRRGGDGVFLRAYDKGLESKELPADRWHRLEGEYHGSSANRAFRILMDGPDPFDVTYNIPEGLTWAERAMAIVLGSVDFREARGDRKNRSLKRRPRVQFWKEVLGSLEAVRFGHCKAPRFSSLEKTSRWMDYQCLPHLRKVAKRRGCTVQEAFMGLYGHLLELRGNLDSRAPVIYEALEYLKVQDRKRGRSGQATGAGKAAWASAGSAGGGGGDVSAVLGGCAGAGSGWPEHSVGVEAGAWSAGAGGGRCLSRSDGGGG